MVISAVACHFFCGIEETGNSYYFPKFTFIKLSNDIQLAMFSFKVARIQIFSWRTPAKVRSNLNIIVTLIICKSTVWVNFSKQKLNNSKNSGNCQLNILTFHLVIFVSLPSCADHSRFPIPDSPFPVLVTSLQTVWKTLSYALACVMLFGSHKRIFFFSSKILGKFVRR